MRWTVHVARMGEMEMRTKFWLQSLTERDHSEDLDVDGSRWLGLMNMVMKLQVA
jgi:hypothetical protein